MHFLSIIALAFAASSAAVPLDVAQDKMRDAKPSNLMADPSKENMDNMMAQNRPFNSGPGKSLSTRRESDCARDKQVACSSSRALGAGQEISDSRDTSERFRDRPFRGEGMVMRGDPNAGGQSQTRPDNWRMRPDNSQMRYNNPQMYQGNSPMRQVGRRMLRDDQPERLFQLNPPSVNKIQNGWKQPGSFGGNPRGRMAKPFADQGGSQYEQPNQGVNMENPWNSMAKKDGPARDMAYRDQSTPFDKAHAMFGHHNQINKNDKMMTKGDGTSDAERMTGPLRLSERSELNCIMCDCSSLTDPQE
jgi:hypothetical protein